MFLQLAATKIQATYRGYSQRKRAKKIEADAGEKVPSSIDENGSDPEAGTNTIHLDESAKLNSSSKVDGNKSNQPQQGPPSKSGPAKKEVKKSEGSSKKEENQSTVPPLKAEVNHKSKEPSKKAIKST